MAKVSGGKTNKTKMVLAGLTAGALVTAIRPAMVAKVYAADNSFEWEKQDIDRLGGLYSSAARSANGTHLILGVQWGGEGMGQASPLYISNNSGAAWENVAPELDSTTRNMWTSVDVSNNGQVMVAASDWGMDISTTAELDGKIFVSENGGSTWTNVTPDDTDNWESVIVSGDGSKIAAINHDDDGALYVSENSGSTWTTVNIPDVWNVKSVSMSDDGDTMLVGGENTDYYTKLYISENGGSGWDDVSPNFGEQPDSFTTDISADGTKIIASTDAWNGSQADEVWVSQNTGAQWTEVDPDSDNGNYWIDTAMSDDGSAVSVLDEYGKMFVSNDLGATWNEEDPGQEYEDTNTWRAVDFNSDGTKAIVAGEENAYITTGATPEPSTPSVNLVNPESGKAIQITTPDGTTITCHSAVKESSLTAQDPTYTYPVGLVDFCFDTDEESNAVTLTFVTDLTPSQAVIRKYNPTTNAYSTVSEASVTETTYEGQHALQVTYTIVDNGPLDMNPEPNEIADPVGIGVVAAQAGLANTGQSMMAYLILAGALFAVGIGSVKLRNQKK